ncbi:RagB/SusD family nutrient uptake outer membrane protein [uncultured Draconibacterium sp.]|uniref:RagB/SusD family nutrient uptake outer membrane protein n=1 Tax=uncultured Draconibacterium sp. TaxID=1573823 RepID=UPI0029C7A1E5|nr:RagB/SusD family nutrient uptake outer membrane protein [uncultured Draconibacterium sp.]
MKNISFLFCLGVLLLISCEELVEVDNPTNQLGTEQVFETIQTANAAMAGLYADLRDRSLISGAGYYSVSTLTASYADNLDCYNNDQNGNMDIYHNQQQVSNRIIASLWNTTYTQVYYTNSIIHGAELSTSLSTEEKNQLKGEALLIRSLLYFYLHRIFGAIPYTSSIDYEYNRSLTKTESAVLLEQLESDLSEAISLLNDNYRNAQRIYPNRKVAEIVLANVYLTEQKYQLAEQMASGILQSPFYQFQPDLNEVFHKTGGHILWQLSPQNSGDATKEASFYYFSDAAPHAYALSDDLVGSFAESDLRKQSWMTQVSFNDDSWYRPYKYKNLSGTNNNEYSVVFRLEEVYFILAEALAKQNRQDEALPYLNATRERAGLDALTNLSSEDFITELLAEKRREFFTEFGHRFFDLKRLGRLDELNSTKPNWEDFKARWPLPQSELLLNANLYPQNEGY